jgi:hypothetical protein
MSPEKRAIAVVWSHKGFCVLQALAFALWAALAMGWFWLPDSQSWTVVLSAVLIVPILWIAIWLIAATFVFYRQAHAGDDCRLSRVYGEAWRRSPALLAWAAILILALWLALRPSAPRWIWIAVPMLLLPLGARIATEGLAGAFENVWGLRYFVQFVLLAAIGAFLPWGMIVWRPTLPGIALQSASLAARFLIAYLLAMSSWLIMASLLVGQP